MKKKNNYSIIVLFSVLISIGICFLSVNFGEHKRAEIAGAQNNRAIGAIDIFKPVKLEGWGSGWVTSAEFDGNDMPIDALVESKNIDMDIKKSIAPRLGSEVLGTESGNTNPIFSLHTSKALDGRELMIRSHTTVLEWWNAIDSTWETLQTGYKTGNSFSFVDGITSTETANYTYFTNGTTDAIRRFRIAFGTLSTTTGATTTLNSVTGHDSVDDVGFDTTGTVMIDGTEYSYTGISGWSLTGMTAVPTSLAENTGIISQVEDPNDFTDAPTKSSALVIKDQRLYAASNNSVYCSKIDDFMDFSYSAPRVASEGEIVIFPEGGDKITGLAVRPTYVAVMKKDYIGKLEFKDFGADFSDIPVINTIVKEIDIGSVNQKSIVNKNFSVAFINNDMGISELTRLENKDFDETISLSERIRPSIQDYTLTDAAIGIYEDKILQAVRNDAGYNNTIIVYDFTRDRFSEFTGWNASSFTVFGDNLYYGDSITENVYKAFSEEYNDNDLPYSTSWKSKWFNFGEADRWKEIDRLFIEGFITAQTTIVFTINLDEGGDLTSKSITISGDGDYVASNPGEGFGINPFGLSNFINVKADSDNLLHFSGYILLDDLFDTKFRNIQFQGQTSDIDSNYRISKIIPYINLLESTYCIDYSSCVIND